MKPIVNYGLSDSLIDAVRKSVEEALVGGQKKLDVDKDGKLEKSDFASLRAKKDAVNTKPKLKEEEQMDEANSDNPAYEKDLIKIDMHHYKEADHHRKTLRTLGTQGKLNTPEGRFHTAALEKHQSALNAMAASDHERMRKKLKQSMRSNLKREEVDQMDEAVKNFDVEPKRAWKIVHHLNGVGIRTKTEANDDRGSVNIKATHKDPAHLAIHISRAVDAHAQDHALSARMRGQLRASGVEPKPMKKEEYEQIDELSVNKMLKYTDAANKNREVLNKKWDTGTATEREKNKVLSHEKGEERAGTLIKAKTGKNPNEIGKLSRMKYAITREETEVVDYELDVNEINGVKMETIDERHLTAAEKEKKEDTVKSMKKGMAGFKERYGDRAKEVMYATATKQAKKDA